MPSLLRSLLLLVAVLLVPVLPFLLFGSALEARMAEWLSRWSSPPQTAGLVVGLLATDVLLPVPSSLVATLGGGRLGWAAGTAAAWCGMSLGATLGFALARYGGRPLAERLARREELQRMEELSCRYGPALLVLARAVPVFAEASVLLMGLERLPWQSFLPPVLLSNLGIALAYSAFGDFAAGHQWLPLALGVSLALPLLVGLLARHYLSRHAAT